MKYLLNFKNIFIIVLSIFYLSCGEPGKDGIDGDPNLAVSWAVAPFSFSTDDPLFPSLFFNGTYYTSTPGTHAFAYESWDGSLWYGNYTLTYNPGTAGEDSEFPFLEDGEDGVDGEDTCFELLCLSGGANLYTWSCFSRTTNRIMDERIENEVKKFENSNMILDESLKSESLNIELQSYSLNKNDPNVIIQSGKAGNYEYELLTKRIKEGIPAID